MAHYGPERFWLPNGSLLASKPARIFPRFSNVLAPIFSDAALTTPLSNPTSTDAFGFLEFYAAAGDYWIFVNGIPFPEILEDDEANSWHAVIVHDQVVAADPWIISHGLNTVPAVTVIDSTGAGVGFAQVNYIDLNNVEIDFGAPMIGIAYLRR